jgi:hypothetical protein
LIDQKTSTGIKVAILSIIALGIATLVYSTFFISEFFAMVSFSLIFWGIILLYITPTSTPFMDLLNSLTGSSTANIERILTEFNINQKGIYMLNESNSRLFGNFETTNNTESVLVFLSENPNVIQENTYPIEDSPTGGLYLTPPGLALCEVFEKRMGQPFSKISQQQFSKKLSNVIKKLKLAERVSVEIKENITVTLTKSIFEEVCQVTNGQSKANKQVGCVITSAIACAVTKVIGKPIFILDETYDSQLKTRKIKYKIMEKAKD